MTNNRMYLVLGDWSEDGHGKMERVLFSSNKEVPQIQQAYKDSCKLTGISFNHNEDYTGIERGGEEEKFRICVEYEQQYLSKEIVNVLTSFSYPNLKDLFDESIEEYCFENTEKYCELWWWFISLSLPSVTYEIEKDDIPAINGYWGNLNVQFGYGLFL